MRSFALDGHGYRASRQFVLASVNQITGPPSRHCINEKSDRIRLLVDLQSRGGLEVVLQITENRAKLRSKSTGSC